MAANGRTATAYNGVMYVSNETSKTVDVWTADGKGESYNVGQWLKDNDAVYSTNAETGEKTYFYNWVNITSDDAGNILVGLVATAGGKTSSNKWLVIPAADRTSMQILDLTLPEGVAVDRVDNAGRIIGDVFKKAYFLVTPNASAKAALLTLEGVEGKVTQTNAITLDSKLTFGSQTPATSIATFDEFEAKKTDEEKYATLYVRDRGVNLYKYDGTQFSALISNVANGTAAGFDVFEIGGKEYAVMPIQDSSSLRTSYCFVVIDMATKGIVATNKVEYPNTYQGSITSRVNKDGKVDIYVYAYNHKIGKFTFTAPDVDTAIESVEVAAGAVEYYNLQGVKVANPENGLFIKKQGNKVSKVVL